MKNIFLFLIVLLLIQRGHAQERAVDIESKDFSTFTEEELENMDKGDNLPKQRDEQSGLFLKAHNINDDSSRVSLLFHFNPDYESLMGVSTFEFIYAHKFELAWVEAFVSQTSATFSEITENNASVQTETDELRATAESILSLGLGIGYHSTWIRELIPSDALFTSTSASLAYHTFSEKFSGNSFTGYGLKTDFGIYRRTSANMHIGTKMSYNLAQVAKPQEFDGEPSASRSYLLTWLTLAFDISFYF